MLRGFLTLTDMSSVEGSCHPGLLVVTRATTITALPACVVFTFAAKLLHTEIEEKHTLTVQEFHRVVD